MKQFLFLIIASICCVACSNNNEPKQNATREEMINEVERELKQSTHGIPLVIPIVTESDPTIYVIPVTESNKNIVEKVFVLDARKGNVNYRTDIYQLDSVIRSKTKDCDLVVTDLKGRKKRLCIDDDPLIISSIIMDINEINYSKNSKIKIPIIHVPDDE